MLGATYGEDTGVPDLASSYGKCFLCSHRLRRPGTPLLFAPHLHACWAAILVCSRIFWRIQNKLLTTLRSSRICVFCSCSFSRHVCAAMRTAWRRLPSRLLGSGRTGSRGMLIGGCRTFLGRSGTLAGTPAGELGPEGWHSPCPTVLAGITHGWTSGGTENDSAVYSGCLLLSQQHSQRQDPLLSGGPWGPHQNLGFLYGPSGCQRWWNLWQTLLADPLPPECLMTHTPTSGLGLMRHKGLIIHSVAAICMDGNMS